MPQPFEQPALAQLPYGLDYDARPMGKSTRHEWRERTPEGETKIYRAWVRGGDWHMQYTLKTEPDWHTIDPIPKEELILLREKMWDKYQRNRVPFKHIEQIDMLIEDAPE